jgi:hypothetical protein
MAVRPWMLAMKAFMNYSYVKKTLEPGFIKLKLDTILLTFGSPLRCSAAFHRTTVSLPCCLIGA